MESADLTVPTHLQDLFDRSVAQGDLAPTHQSNLAALLRRHSDAFATGPMDLGYCSVLEHDIDTGDAKRFDSLHVVHLSPLDRRQKIS